MSCDMSSAGYKISVDGLSHCIGSRYSENLMPMTPFATAVAGVIGCRTITKSCMWCAATPEAGKDALWFGGMPRGFGFDCIRCHFVCWIPRCNLVYWFFKLLSGNSRFGFETSLAQRLERSDSPKKRGRFWSVWRSHWGQWQKWMKV